MRSTRIYLLIAFLAACLPGTYWVLVAQEGPRWEAPTIEPIDERVAQNKVPIKIGAQPINEKPKAADPSMIVPPAAYETPRPIKADKGSGIELTGGTAPALPEKKDDKLPSLPALPGLIPELPESKPLVQPELPAPLPPPQVEPPLPEPTKVLIADPPAKKELPSLPPAMLIPSEKPKVDEKKELFPPPKVLIEPQQAPTLPTMPKVDTKPAATLIVPGPQVEDKVKSFVRVRPDKGIAPSPDKGIVPPPPLPVGKEEKPGDDHARQMAELMRKEAERKSPSNLVVIAPSITQGSILTLQTPSMTVEKRGTAPTYQIVIRNVGTVPGVNVRVEDDLPAGAKIAYADPMPTMQGDKAVWVVAQIASLHEVTLSFTLQTQGALPTSHQTSVHVSATSQTHTTATPVRHEVNPLSIRIQGPIKAVAGKPIVMQVRVGNQSSRPISGLKLYGNLPEGLNTPEGRNIEGPDDGMTFQPGEFKTLKMPADAVKAGRYMVRVKLATSAGLEASDAAAIEITGESLSLQQAPQVKLMPSRDGDLRIDVTNNTGRSIRNVSVVNRLPDGLDFIAANEAGLYQSNSRTVYWTIKDLADGKAQTLYVRVNGSKPGQYQNTVTAKADGVAMQTSTSQILLEGMADLSLRVVGREGPISVGREVTYEVQVQNRGLSADRNVQLQVQFPPGLTPRGANGPMRHSMDKQTVLFEPIATVGPQGQASFRVSALAQAPGDQRVRFAIVSEQVRNPIQREVSTMVYRD